MIPRMAATGCEPGGCKALTPAAGKADTRAVSQHTNAEVRGSAGTLRPAVFWLVYAPGRGTKTHAVIEGNERTICGRAADYEVSDEEYVLGGSGGQEPSCRPCRQTIRRARAGDPSLSARFRPERLLCPRCLRGDMTLTVREVSVDRCAVLLDQGVLVYDVDGDPKHRVEERRLECRRCNTVLAEKDLIRASAAWPGGNDEFDHAAFQARRAAASKAAAASLAAAVERRSQPAIDTDPF